MKLLLASRNPKKTAELKAMLAGLEGFQLVSLADFPAVPPVVEDGSTFRDNALKKARVCARSSGLLTLADDSGLKVDALGGAPGVHSARFAGPGQDDRANCRQLLEALKDVPPARRTARFVCVVALADARGFEAVREGRVEGLIGLEEKGPGGFGYDPLFIYPPAGKTFAEIPPQDKNRVSHRFKAMEAARVVLSDYRLKAEKSWTGGPFRV